MSKKDTMSDRELEQLIKTGIFDKKPSDALTDDEFKYLFSLGVFNNIQNHIQSVNSSESIIINNINYKIIHQKPDGNCLFRCFAYSMLGNSEKFLEAKNQLRKFMIDSKIKFEDLGKENPLLFDVHVPGEEDQILKTFDEYLDKMNEPNFWGGQLEIFAAVYLYQRPCIIITKNGGRTMYSGSNPDNPPIYLLFSGNNHYDILEQADIPLIQNTNILEQTDTLVIQQNDNSNIELTSDINIEPNNYNEEQLSFLQTQIDEVNIKIKNYSDELSNIKLLKKEIKKNDYNTQIYNIENQLNFFKNQHALLVEQINNIIGEYSNNIDWKSKYHKYKSKYLSLKQKL